MSHGTPAPWRLVAALALSLVLLCCAGPAPGAGAAGLWEVTTCEVGKDEPGKLSFDVAVARAGAAPEGGTVRFARDCVGEQAVRLSRPVRLSAPSGGAPAGRWVTIDGGGRDVWLSGERRSAVLVATNVNLMVRGVTITAASGSDPAARHGLVYEDDGTHTLEVVGARFLDNPGGGLRLRGTGGKGVRARVASSTFAGNSAAWGAGIAADDVSAGLTVVDCTFVDNVAGVGAGLMVGATSRHRPQVTMANTSFLGNTTPGVGAGWAVRAGGVTMANVTVR
ncbi:MAG TPA: hypothetical protein VH257_02940 [Chloroflexota bacterium]|nr:hypothetical protein [Chloroflexota bacterium]